jgi:hypothetical protein
MPGIKPGMTVERSSTKQRNVMAGFIPAFHVSLKEIRGCPA